ncbi:MAG TPA: D-aminoacyl-tRNA deacylase [Phycisphaerales bacterium]|nr:D-aminoacyl-tRNA deacylase [Phycisphaerales bacterium]
MRAVVQRVSSASVTVNGGVVGGIGRGLLVLVGIEQADSDSQVVWLADKCANLRIFEDVQGKMNLSVKDVAGAILLVPNFTIAGEARKGRRPSFDNAMRPEQSEPMFQRVVAAVQAQGVPVQTGVFRAEMQVALVNDGPITIWLDSNG